MSRKGKNKMGFYAIIPANILHDRTLPPRAILLYGELTSLANEKGYCFAGNDFFAELYHVHSNSVVSWLSSLEKRGYIRTEYKYNGMVIKERRIYIQEAIPLIQNPVGTVAEKRNGTVTENCDGTVTENCDGTVTENCDGTVTENCDGTVTENCGDTITVTNTNLHIGDSSDEESVSEKKTRRFVKPSVDEIRQYCTERNNGINAQAFFDFYESNGWKVGQNPMKNWQAAVRTWEQRSKVQSKNTKKDEQPNWLPDRRRNEKLF